MFLYSRYPVINISLFRGILYGKISGLFAGRGGRRRGATWELFMILHYSLGTWYYIMMRRRVVWRGYSFSPGGRRGLYWRGRGLYWGGSFQPGGGEGCIGRGIVFHQGGRGLISHGLFGSVRWRVSAFNLRGVNVLSVGMFTFFFRLVF